jgi:6-phosphogluconolactonase
VLPDRDALAEAGAREFAGAASDAIRDHGIFRATLSGGSTPRAMHRVLASAPLAGSVDWSRVRFFWGDERCVPPDDERSNYRMAKETLLDPLGIPAENVFRMRGEEPPPRAAADYAQLLRREFPGLARPRMDLVYLGLGADGHTASLFPGSRALSERKNPVAANYVAKLREWRLTLTYPALNASRCVVFLVAGAEKRAAVEKILERRRGYRSLPASGVRPTRGSLVWLLDREAAGKLVGDWE